jgi:hypothetical protein
MWIWGWVANTFYGGKTKFLCNIGVLDSAGLIERQPLDPFGHVGRRGDCRATSKSLEFDVTNPSILINPDLKLHDVPTSRCPNPTSSVSTHSPHSKIGAIYSGFREGRVQSSADVNVGFGE